MKNRGSITIFSMISLLLITATIFALLEGTRLQELRRFANLQTESALESMFANYDLTLWESYHLLGTEVGKAEETLLECANGREGSDGINFLSFQTKSCKIDSYSVLTDGHGKAFIQIVSTYMKENLLYEAAKEIYNQYESVKYLLKNSQVDSAKIDEALKEIEKIEAPATSVSTGTSGTNGDTSILDIEELLKEAKKWKENGVLPLFVKDTSKLSSSKYDFSEGLLERELKNGTLKTKEEVDWIDRILLQQYLLSYMSHYRDTQKKRALSYEVEYLLGGRESDKENLQIVIAKILAIREAANFLYLVSDPIKNQQAGVLAMTWGGTSLNPAIIEAIKIGVLTAWALAESILDVRALLAGKKVPLLKSAETWTVDLANIGGITKGFDTAKECDWGVSYENYLGILLLFEEEEALALHAMNVQEATIRTSGNSSFQMDCCMIKATAQISYSYEPIFPFLRVIDAEKRWKYELITKKIYGYYE